LIALLIASFTPAEAAEWDEALVSAQTLEWELLWAWKSVSELE
jgi:hypothetical protein